MGVHFPDGLRASLLRHDGTAPANYASAFGGFDGNGNHGMRDIRDTWRGCATSDGEAEGDVPDHRAEWWNGRMIPFG